LGAAAKLTPFFVMVSAFRVAASFHGEALGSCQSTAQPTP